MDIKQVIGGGKLVGSYLSSWNNELQLTVEGGHEINVKIPEDELRDLANRLKERIETIDTERAEEQARLDNEAEQKAKSLSSEETDG